MKRNALLLLLSLVAFSCFQNKRVMYRLQNNKGHFVFRSTATDTIIEHDVLIWTTDLSERKDRKIDINFIFSECTPNVEKLQSIHTTLMAADKSGQYVSLPGKSTIKTSYFDGAKTVDQSLDNSTPVILNKTIDWKRVNYSYDFAGVNYVKKNNYVSFSCEYDFISEELPDSLKLTVVLKWENGERTYESALIKKAYEGRAFNPKF